MNPDASDVRPAMSTASSFTSTNKSAVRYKNSWGEDDVKLTIQSPASLVGPDGVPACSNRGASKPISRPYAHSRVPQRTASEYLPSSYKPSQDYFNSARPLHGTTTKRRKDSWIDRKLHFRRYKKYLAGNEIKAKVVAGGLARADVVEDFEAISALDASRIPRCFPRRDSVSSTSLKDRSRLRKDKSVNQKDVFSAVKSVVSRIRRRNKKEGEAEPNCPSVVPTEDRFSLDVSSDEEVDYYDADSVITGSATPHGPTPADRRLSQNPLSSSRLVSPVQSRTPCFKSTSSQQTSQNSTFAPSQSPDEDQRPEWQKILEGDMWNKTPSYAGTLSGVSRTSRNRGNSEASSIGCVNDNPSAYEFEVAGKNRVSRSGTTYSGSTAVSSQHHRMSSDAAIASEGGSPRSSKLSKHARKVVDPRSKYSLRSTGKDTRKVPDLRMLDTNLPWNEQDNVVHSMVAV